MNDEYTVCGGGLLKNRPPETPEEIAEFNEYFRSHGMEPPKEMFIDGEWKRLQIVGVSLIKE